VTSRHFLDVDDLSPEELEVVLDLASAPAGGLPRVLAGKGAALVFEKPSARTRSSTELAVASLGGHPVYIQGPEVGIDRRESAEDVARTLACYHAVVCARVVDHDVLVRMARALDAADAHGGEEHCRMARERDEELHGVGSRSAPYGSSSTTRQPAGLRRP